MSWRGIVLRLAGALGVGLAGCWLGCDGSVAARPARCLAVEAVSPQRNERKPSRTAAPGLRLDREIDPASVNAGAVRVFGRWSGAHARTLILEAGKRELRFEPERAFAPGEVVV